MIPTQTQKVGKVGETGKIGKAGEAGEAGEAKDRSQPKAGQPLAESRKIDLFFTFSNSIAFDYTNHILLLSL